MHSKGNLHDDLLKGLKIQGLWIIPYPAHLIGHLSSQRLYLLWRDIILQAVISKHLKDS